MLNIFSKKKNPEDFPKSLLPFAIFNVDYKGLVIDTNKEFKELTGYDSGVYLEELFLEKGLARKHLKEAKKENIKNKELTLLEREGKKLVVNLSLSAYKKGFLGSLVRDTQKEIWKEAKKSARERTKELENSKAALMNILEDVEEKRKEAEEEKNKTLAVITNFSDGLFIFDNKKKLLLANPQAEKFFNFKSEEIEGRSISELSKFSKLKGLIDSIRIEKEVFRKELEVKNNLILELSTAPITTKEEKLGTLVTLHDITREKMVERIKTEFVSLAAHQLRTPLSAIKWTLKMLLEGDLGKISKEQREFIEDSYASNERMIHLINDLLDVARIEEGKYLYEPAPARLEPIVESVINLFQKEITDKKITFNFKKSEKKLPKAVIDAEKIRLAVQNLLENAVKYVLPGGKITILLECNKNEIKFTIKDNGIGIPQDQQSRLFTKFFRGINVEKIDTTGSGLGIFITKNIIEAHGGKIWFESEEGKGTTFYFSLPINH